MQESRPIPSCAGRRVSKSTDARLGAGRHVKEPGKRRNARGREWRSSCRPDRSILRHPRRCRHPVLRPTGSPESRDRQTTTIAPPRQKSRRCRPRRGVATRRPQIPLKPGFAASRLIRSIAASGSGKSDRKIVLAGDRAERLVTNLPGPFGKSSGRDRSYGQGHRQPRCGAMRRSGPAITARPGGRFRSQRRSARASSRAAGSGWAGFAVDQIGAVKPCRVRCRGEKQRRARAFFRRGEKRFCQPPAEPDDAAGQIADLGRDDPGMQRGRDDSGPVETPRQGAREQDIAQFRAAVGLQRSSSRRPGPSMSRGRGSRRDAPARRQ